VTAKSKSAATRRKEQRIAHEAEAGASGALAGAVFGAAAGPAGIVAGAIIGGVAGALTGAVLDSEAARAEAHERELDAEIGTSEGDLGAATSTNGEPAVGAYSAASVGAANSDDHEPAEGPISIPR
jgi:phage tail tape-measure protein